RFEVAAVRVELPTARLLERELERLTKPLEQPHRRLAGVGEQAVDETRAEERNAHVAVHTRGCAPAYEVRLPPIRRPLTRGARPRRARPAPPACRTARSTS